MDTENSNMIGLIKAALSLLNDAILGNMGRKSLLTGQPIGDKVAPVLRNDPAMSGQIQEWKDQGYNDEQIQQLLAIGTDAGSGLVRNVVRGGAGVLADALFNNHLDGYGVMDNVTSGVGGIAGGLLGSWLARKAGMQDNTIVSSIANLGGSALGGWGLNKWRRS